MLAQFIHNLRSTPDFMNTSLSLAACPGAPNREGVTVTKPVLCTGRKLKVSADAAGGSICAGLLLDDPGVTVMFQPITADVTDEIVRMAGRDDFTRLIGTPIQLVFRLTGAKLYSFSFGD